ncbi:MAG: cytochrome C oxidase subunit IV family protein [Gemmatimonadota bacterium]|nr:MAG: cytochrome C oxidase subunit IV family protein [Gemmatimonadota bacterium]
MNEHAQAAQEHAHPTTGTYLAVAGVLTVITLVEVGVFYVPAFASVLAPVLLILSGAKFALVVMFYMHLKTDHKLFTAIFTLPLLIAVAVIVALLFLFGSFSLEAVQAAA